MRVLTCDTHKQPSKHARSHREAFCLRSVMAITASVRPESGRILYADFPHPFQFRFYKEGMGHAVQNRPGSSLGGLIRVWLNSSGMKASWCAGFNGPGNRPATSFPLSDSVPFFTTDVPNNSIQNQPVSDLVLAHCVRFWPNGSGPEESRCARIILPVSGQYFPADPARMRIGSGVFTGNIRLTSMKLSAMLHIGRVHPINTVKCVHPINTVKYRHLCRSTITNIGCVNC